MSVCVHMYESISKCIWNYGTRSFMSLLSTCLFLSGSTGPAAIDLKVLSRVRIAIDVYSTN